MLPDFMSPGPLSDTFMMICVPFKTRSRESAVIAYHLAMHMRSKQVHDSVPVVDRRQAPQPMMACPMAKSIRAEQQALVGEIGSTVRGDAHGRVQNSNAGYVVPSVSTFANIACCSY